MDPRARYPPGNGNVGGGNPNYYGRGPPPQQPLPPHAQAHHQQYLQRQQQSSQHHNFQQHQHQQWLRRNQIAGEGAGAAGASDHKAPPAADGIDSRSQDWKAQLKLPPPDTLYRTEENHFGASPFVHSSLVAASLHLLTSYFSSQWHELVHILLAHPKVDIFMDVAFDSLHEDVRSLNVRLSTLGTAAFPVGPLDSRLTHFICQQCEASLQFLLLLASKSCSETVF